MVFSEKCLHLFWFILSFDNFKVMTGYGFGSKRTQCFFADLDLDWIYSVTLVWRPVGNSIRRHRVKNVIIIYHKLWTAKQYHMQSPICNIKLHTEYRMYTLTCRRWWSAWKFSPQVSCVCVPRFYIKYLSEQPIYPTSPLPPVATFLPDPTQKS